jgi:pimeloyl-ACP methyl ester carboxylesterase
LVWGRQDGLVPPVYADEFKAKLRNAEIALFDGAAHLPQLEQLTPVRERVLAFLA